jgi:hypothetical protein
MVCTSNLFIYRKINNILQFQTHRSFCQTCLLTDHQATFSWSANYLHILYNALYKCMFLYQHVSRMPPHKYQQAVFYKPIGKPEGARVSQWKQWQGFGLDNRGLVIWLPAGPHCPNLVWDPISLTLDGHRELFSQGRSSWECEADHMVLRLRLLQLYLCFPICCHVVHMAYLYLY